MGLGAAGGDDSGVSSPSSGGRLAADGCTSTGATMSVVAHRAPASGCSCGVGHCCIVNIYVNSNVQGVTNSVLVGSKVVMTDPGPRVSSRHAQPRQRDGRRRWRDRDREGKRSSRQQMQRMERTIKIIGILVVAVVSLLFVLAAATILCFHLFVRVSK